MRVHDLSGQWLVDTATSPTGTTDYTYSQLADVASATRTEATAADPVLVTRTHDGRSALLTEVTEVAPGFEYATTWSYADAGRLTGVQVEDTAGSLPVATYSWDYEGDRLRSIAGDLDGDLLDVQLDLEHLGTRVSSRTLGLGPYGDPVEPQLTTLYGFDDAGRPVAADWYRGDLQEDVPLGQHLQVFGKDDRVRASMRGWAEPGGTLLTGQFRAASLGGCGMC